MKPTVFETVIVTGPDCPPFNAGASLKRGDREGQQGGLRHSPPFNAGASLKR